MNDALLDTDDETIVYKNAGKGEKRNAIIEESDDGLMDTDDDDDESTPAEKKLIIKRKKKKTGSNKQRSVTFKSTNDPSGLIAKLTENDPTFTHLELTRQKFCLFASNLDLGEPMLLIAVVTSPIFYELLKAIEMNETVTKVTIPPDEIKNNNGELFSFAGILQSAHTRRDGYKLMKSLGCLSKLEEFQVSCCYSNDLLALLRQSKTIQSLKVTKSLDLYGFSSELFTHGSLKSVCIHLSGEDDDCIHDFLNNIPAQIHKVKLEVLTFCGQVADRGSLDDNNNGYYYDYEVPCEIDLSDLWRLQSFRRVECYHLNRSGGRQTEPIRGCNSPKSRLEYLLLGDNPIESQLGHIVEYIEWGWNASLPTIIVPGARSNAAWDWPLRPRTTTRDDYEFYLQNQNPDAATRDLDNIGLCIQLTRAGWRNLFQRDLAKDTDWLDVMARVSSNVNALYFLLRKNTALCRHVVTGIENHDNDEYDDNNEEESSDLDQQQKGPNNSTEAGGDCLIDTDEDE